MKLQKLLAAAAAALFVLGVNAGQRKPVGAAGLAFEVDHAKKEFKVMIPVAYDPKSDKGASLKEFRWDEKTVFYHWAPADIKTIAPQTMGKLFLQQEQAARLDAGKPFQVKVLQFRPGLKERKSVKFRTLPVTLTQANRGMVHVNGKEIPFKAGEVVHFVKSDSAGMVAGVTRVMVSAWDYGKGLPRAAEVMLNPLPDPRKTEDPNLPRALVIGDSISMNYHKAAGAALKGKVNYSRIFGNSGDTRNGLVNLDLWLGPMKEKYQKWDVVLINHGLHDLRQKATADRKDFVPKHQIDVEEYAANFDKLLSRLCKHDFKVIVITTTPVPNSNFGRFGRRKDEDLKYNAALLEVVKKYPKVQVLDLNKVVRESPAFDEWRKGNNVHYKEKEQQVLGQAVAGAILAALQK